MADFLENNQIGEYDNLKSKDNEKNYYDFFEIEDYVKNASKRRKISNVLLPVKKSNNSIDIIGMEGGFLGGMTTVSKYLEKQIENLFVIKEECFLKDIDIKEILLEDEMYLIKENPTYPKERRIDLIKKSSPKSYDYDKLYDILKKILNKKDVEFYDPTEKKTIKIKNKDNLKIIVEGYFIFNNKINDLINLKIFKDSEDDVRLSRLLKREKQYLEENIENCKLFFDIYEKILKKSFEEYIIPDKTTVNIILPDYTFVNGELGVKDMENIMGVLSDYISVKKKN